jgi:capsular polysaccharide biosynthesis protein
MSQQVLDLRRSMQIIRRHWLLVGVIVVLGVVAGSAYAVLKPPLRTSTALVVFPPSVQNSNAAAGGTNSFTATLQVIASSNQVLAAALPDVQPAMSLQQLRHVIATGSLTANIISISAEAKIAADAEATANAVADSYIKYVNARTSPIGRQGASLLQPASSAGGSGPLETRIVDGFLGAVGGLLIGVIVVLAFSHRDKRLRVRDQIANSVGLPILASFPVARPSDAAGWSRLLLEYKPGAVYAWGLRTALRRVGVPDDVLGGRGGSSLGVLSLASDPGALAIGPQLAAFASSLGIPTVLAIGPQQDENAVATLRTACAAPLPASPTDRNHLRVVVCDAGDFDRLPSATLTVVVTVVDGQTPRIPDTMRTTTTVLGVSAGAATAEDLARTAVSAAIGGREILGILVANPDPDDNTTGQVPRLAGPTGRRMPTRLNGMRMTTEIRR